MKCVGASSQRLAQRCDYLALPAVIVGAALRGRPSREYNFIMNDGRPRRAAPTMHLTILRQRSLRVSSQKDLDRFHGPVLYMTVRANERVRKLQ